jgi:hypothetical protein
MLRPQLKQESVEPRLFWIWIIGLTVAATVWWVLMDVLAARTRGGGVSILLSLVMGTAALSLVNASSQRLGQLSGAVAIALGVIAVVGFWGRESMVARGTLLVIVVLLLGMLVSGKFFADLTLRDMLLLAAAPLAMWAGKLPWVRNHWLRRFAVSALAVLIVLAIPLTTAVTGLRTTMREQSEGYEYGY